MMSVLQKIDIDSRQSVCEKHGDYQEQGANIGGVFRWFGCELCREERQAADKAVTRELNRQEAVAEERRAALRRFRGVGIPPRFQQRTFGNYRADGEQQAKAYRVAKAYADSFQHVLKHGASLVLCGGPGTGKTHLAAAIANQLYQQHTVLFRGVLAAIRHVKSSWNRDSEYDEETAIADLVKPDLLILDDVGAQFGSEAERVILFEILNGRYEQFRPTIITANLTIDELNGYLGERVMDRLTEGGGAVIVFDWQSYRPQVAKDSALPGLQTLEVAHESA